MTLIRGDNWKLKISQNIFWLHHCIWHLNNDWIQFLFIGMNLNSCILPITMATILNHTIYFDVFYTVATLYYKCEYTFLVVYFFQWSIIFKFIHFITVFLNLLSIKILYTLYIQRWLIAKCHITELLMAFILNKLKL